MANDRSTVLVIDTPLSPWTGNVDAAGYSLTNLGTLYAQFVAAANTAASAQNLGSLFQVNLPDDALGSLVWWGKSFATNAAIGIGFRPRATAANSELVFATYGGAESLIITAAGVTKAKGVLQCLGDDGSGHALSIQLGGSGPVGSYGPDRIDANATFALLASTANNAVLCGGGGNVSIGGSVFPASMAKGLGIANGTAPSASPVGGGVLYVLAGALRYRGSSGTDVQVAAA